MNQNRLMGHWRPEQEPSMFALVGNPFLEMFFWKALVATGSLSFSVIEGST